MRAKEFIDYLVSLGFNVFPDANYMPDVEESKLPALFIFSSGGSEPDKDLPIEYPTFQIIIKGRSYKMDSSQMDATEHLAMDVINTIRTEEQLYIGANLVYYIRPMQSNPIPIGLDTYDRPVYSTNFSLKLQPIKEGSN